jgi:hypothetical protein
MGGKSVILKEELRYAIGQSNTQILNFQILMVKLLKTSQSR